jgi:hypothetical protein
MALFECATCHAVYSDFYPEDDSCLKCMQGLVRIVTDTSSRTQYQETTMTAIKPTIKLFISQDDDSAGIHINSFILVHQDNHYQFPGGAGDTVHVFAESIALYVLTINKSNGTMALNAFMSPEPDPINSVYLHTPRDIKETLGAKWELLSPMAITTKLINCLI